MPGIRTTSRSVGVAAEPPLPELLDVPTPELTDRMSLWWSLAAMLAARMEAESRCSSSWLLAAEPPDPVDVSLMELPEEKGGRERSESEGEEGLRM
jgi:hypothetical protein